MYSLGITYCTWRDMGKLSRMESEYPCKCGHQEFRHGTYTGRSVCWGCECMISKYLMSRHEYEADNLRYLEERYEKAITKTNESIAS